MKTRTGYLIKRGKTYYACWTVAGKKFMKSTHRADKDQARKELAVIVRPFMARATPKNVKEIRDALLTLVAT